MKTAAYFTTPIYYVTDKPHIGHLYTTLAADILSRYHRLLGKEVFFLTGTDEHGQKIEKKARETSETPQALADRVVERYRTAWERYGVEYTDFIRTTEQRHKTVVQNFVKRLVDKADVYLGTYEGWYCVPDEAYWSESQLNEGHLCPSCGRPVERLQEESYFFKLSAYVAPLVAHIESHPDFIFPESRRNEVLGFLKQQVHDISASRTTIRWGIEFPTTQEAKKDHTVYVWFDALTNYLSALDPLGENTQVAKFWPHAVHLVGKDILRFHAVYWPAFLMALGMPLPKQIVAHGWLTDSQKKIGKSLGNAIDPMVLADSVGVDAMRYFLFREFVFGQDGEYTQELMYHRINADLANDYGNCLSRVCNMAVKRWSGEPVNLSGWLQTSSPMKEHSAQVVADYHDAMEHYHFERALAAAWRLSTETNRFIETTAPWSLAKSTLVADHERLDQVLAHCVEALRIQTLLTLPFMPTSAARALEFLGVSAVPERAFEFTQWGTGPTQFKISRPAPLFPRLELPKLG